MNAPTPGKWDFACDSYGKVVHSKKACVYAAQLPTVRTIAARIPNWADAALISAAPDLLAACEAFYRAFADEDLHGMVDAQALADAAIAKAKGDAK